VIGFLRGEIVQKQPPILMLDVQGVGYEINAPMSTFYALPALGKTVQVLTHLTVREDAHILYGFVCEGDRQLFRNLIKVNGVGPKLALTILSGMNSDEFSLAVQNSDAAALVRLPGIGKKTAERLVIEMRDKVAEVGEVQSAEFGQPSHVQQSPMNDALSALISLGYKPTDANKMIKGVKSEGLASDEIIRLALRGVSV
jgi:holliday junction DNA helicase RuvA